MSRGSAKWPRRGGIEMNKKYYLWMSLAILMMVIGNVADAAKDWYHWPHDTNIRAIVDGFRIGSVSGWHVIKMIQETGFLFTLCFWAFSRLRIWWLDGINLLCLLGLQWSVFEATIFFIDPNYISSVPIFELSKTMALVITAVCAAAPYVLPSLSEWYYGLVIDKMARENLSKKIIEEIRESQRGMHADTPLPTASDLPLMGENEKGEN
jgi:hypothetical protein